MVISKLFIYSFRTCSTGIEFLSLILRKKEGKGNKFSRVLLKNNFAAKIIRRSIISLFKSLHRYQHRVEIAMELENVFKCNLPMFISSAYEESHFSELESQDSGHKVLQSFFSGKEEKTLLRLFQLFRHFCLRRET